MKSKTFAQAVVALAENPISICYDVRHNGSFGDLVTREYYRMAVESFFFMDMDGHGLALDVAGSYLENTQPSDFSDLPVECAYVLWFNK